MSHSHFPLPVSSDYGLKNAMEYLSCEPGRGAPLTWDTLPAKDMWYLHYCSQNYPLQGMLPPQLWVPLIGSTPVYVDFEVP